MESYREQLDSVNCKVEIVEPLLMENEAFSIRDPDDNMFILVFLP